MKESREQPGHQLENYRGILIDIKERDGRWQARAAGIGALSSLHASASDAGREIKQYIDDDAAGLAYRQPTPTDLRRIAAWYRVFAEKAGSPAIWEARLHLAEDLEAEAARLESGSAT